MRIYELPGVRAEIIRPGMPLATWLARQTVKPYALINASLYRSDGSPIGTIIENGKVRANAGTGFGFGILRGGSWAFGTPWMEPWQEYLTGYTGLVQEGAYVAPAFPDVYVFDCSLNRIAIGEKDGVLQIVTDDAVDAYTFGRRGALAGLRSLVNLDGGGSRFLYIDGKTIYTSARTPYNAIAFYKEDQDDMTYSNSSLISEEIISKHSSPRTAKIDRITVHHSAAVTTARALGVYFQTAQRPVSANYMIGNDGKIVLGVPESNRACTSSSQENDNRAVTIEVSNSKAAYPWPVSAAAWKSLVRLVADVCRRNGIPRLIWSDDKAERIAGARGCNLTLHRDFAATQCPGQYLLERMPALADEVNEQLGAKPPAPDAAPDPVQVSPPAQAETPPEGYDQWLRCWEWHEKTEKK